MKKKLSHYDESGAPRMVDISSKQPTKRTARAHAFVRMLPQVLAQLPENPKGNPLDIARVAGISAAKKTSEIDIIEEGRPPGHQEASPLGGLTVRFEH